MFLEELKIILREAFTLSIRPAIDKFLFEHPEVIKAREVHPLELRRK